MVYDEITDEHGVSEVLSDDEYAAQQPAPTELSAEELEVEASKMTKLKTARNAIKLYVETHGSMIAAWPRHFLTTEYAGRKAVLGDIEDNMITVMFRTKLDGCWWQVELFLETVYEALVEGELCK